MMKHLPRLILFVSWATACGSDSNPGSGVTGGDDAGAHDARVNDGSSGGSGGTGGNGTGGNVAVDAAMRDAAMSATGGNQDGGPSDGSVDNDAGQDGSIANDAGTDTMPPTILSISPQDLTTGVTADTRIMITFSEPMNTSSVAAAYQSADIPRANAIFGWNGDETVLIIEPFDPLPYAVGTDPSAVTAPVIAYTISTAAKDKAGNPMASSFSASFSTLRDITQTLVPVAALQGNVRDDGNVAGKIFMGDTNFDMTVRGFVSYSLANVPGTIQTFLSATLALTQTELLGSPYSDLGALHLRSIQFATLDSTAYSASYTRDTAISEFGTEKNVDVLDFVQQDLASASAYSQYRIEFATGTDGDSAFDSVTFSSTSPLVLHYLLP